MEKLFLVCIFLVVLLSCVGDDVFAEEQEILLATGEWAPYTSKTMEGYGIFTEIVSAAFKEMGLRPKYVFAPWKRSELMVENGEVFAAFPFVISDERQKDFDFSERVAFSTGRFFYCTKRFVQEVPYEMLNDLQQYFIGGVLGYWYEPLFKKAQLETHFVSSEKQLIMMLYSKRVDFAPLDELVGWQLIRQYYPQDTHLFKTLTKPLNLSSLHLLVSRKYPNAATLTKQFNAALERIHQKGIYQKIFSKHGVPEWNPAGKKSTQ